MNGDDVSHRDESTHPAPAPGEPPPPPDDAPSAPPPPARTSSSDVVADDEPRRRGRAVAIVAAMLLALLLLGAAGAAYATYRYAEEYDGRILPGATIAGVDVGGMTPRRALRAVKAAVRPQLQRTITIRHRDREWEATAKELGARSDARAAVRAAVAASDAATMVDKARMRLLGDRLDHAGDVGVRYSRKEPRGFVEGLAATLQRDARDASLDYSSGWVEVVPERVGRRVRVDATFADLMRALRRGKDRVELTVALEKPAVTSDAFDEVLLLRIGENKLYLYDDGRISRSWTVATGQPEYPTPQGVYEIIEKRYLPTWVNPDPDGWGKDMPKEIGPGPDNPLGVRALRWSEPTINFHGTRAISSLGYNASHGCVRMSNSDVIQLYGLVDVGTPIVSIQVGSLRPMYSSSAPDPTVVPRGDAR
ncbi:MAG TPA: L,D-transpeptidase/peptidoglycan binding protein [Actinomycetota bacterium]|nr:L,D-transpeptidase/peptidoglycan binding protein [Actinomycetota bacterium]